jgi:multidrug efflux system outer membrane protein
MNKVLLVLLLGAVGLTTGCKLSPRYTRPTPPVPGDWPTGAAYATTVADTNAPSVADVKWATFFTDAKLRQIIAGALTNNLDLRLALLNVDAAQALYGVQRDELFPAFNANGSMSKSRVPADLSNTGSRHTSTRYDVNLGLVSWEIDFFGRIRCLKDRALEEFLASEQTRRNTQILLVASVANAYLTLAADRESLHLSQTTLKAQEDSYALVKHRYDIGIVTELDLYQAQTQVDTARGNVALYKQLEAQDINALNLLAGAPVPTELLPTQLNEIVQAQALRPETPSEVLLCRPDVAESEAMLRAAYADIGAARAAFFPSISLTAAAGTASSQLSGLFKGGSGAWSYAPQASMPIFDARTWSAYRVAKSQRAIALTQYQKSIQSAFKEVADALAVRSTIDERVDAQQSLVNAVAATYKLSSSRYDKGIDSYLSVLDAQRSLFSAQQGLVSLRLAKASSLVHLYAVLGGGADDGIVEPPVAPAQKAEMAPLLKTP